MIVKCLVIVIVICISLQEIPGKSHHKKTTDTTRISFSHRHSLFSPKRRHLKSIKSIRSNQPSTILHTDREKLERLTLLKQYLLAEAVKEVTHIFKDPKPSFSRKHSAIIKTFHTHGDINKEQLELYILQRMQLNMINSRFNTTTSQRKIQEKTKSNKTKIIHGDKHLIKFLSLLSQHDVSDNRAGYSKAADLGKTLAERKTTKDSEEKSGRFYYLQGLATMLNNSIKVNDGKKHKSIGIEGNDKSSAPYKDMKHAKPNRVDFLQDLVAELNHRIDNNRQNNNHDMKENKNAPNKTHSLYRNRLHNKTSALNSDKTLLKMIRLGLHIRKLLPNLIHEIYCNHRRSFNSRNSSRNRNPPKYNFCNKSLSLNKNGVHKDKQQKGDSQQMNNAARVSSKQPKHHLNKMTSGLMELFALLDKKGKMIKHANKVHTNTSSNVHNRFLKVLYGALTTALMARNKSRKDYVVEEGRDANDDSLEADNPTYSNDGDNEIIDEEEAEETRNNDLVNSAERTIYTSNILNNSPRYSDPLEDEDGNFINNVNYENDPQYYEDEGYSSRFHETPKKPDQPIPYPNSYQRINRLIDDENSKLIDQLIGDIGEDMEKNNENDNTRNDKEEAELDPYKRQSVNYWLESMGEER